MAIIEHKTSNLLLKIDNATSAKVAGELIATLFSVKDLYNYINDVEESTESLDEDSDEYWEAIDDFQINVGNVAFGTCSTVLKYAKNSCSDISAISRGLLKVYEDIDGEEEIGEDDDGNVITKPVHFDSPYNLMLKDRDEIFGLGCDKDLLERFKKEVYEVLSQVAYAIRYDFVLDQTVESAAKFPGDLKQLVVDHAFSDYCSSNNLDSTETACEIVKISVENKPKLAVFDERPDLEDEYYNVVGPYASDVDEDRLTVKDVEDIIAGKVLPVDLYEHYGSGREEL
jgi:hypothetical protein